MNSFPQFWLVYLSLCARCISTLTFNNSVTANRMNPNRQGEYEIELTLSYALSMSIYNAQRDTWDPVLIKSDTGTRNIRYEKRTNRFDALCSASSVMSDEEKQRLIVTDGRHRRLIVFNQLLPGPPIVVPKNAKMVVHVTNDLPSEGVSVHWHGQRQPNNHLMDGVTRLTQWPVDPGETFTYRFIATDAGTHWYHTHSGVQRTDGAYGPLIVLESTPSIYKDEFIFMIQDWLDIDSVDMAEYVMWENIKFFYGYDNETTCYSPTRSMDHTEVSPIKVDSVIINGKGWYDIGNLDLSSFGSVASIYPIERFLVEPNQKYLFRVIGANTAIPMRVSVDEHQLTVVASDGNAIQGEAADYLIVNAGERYDFFIETNASRAKNYWIRVETTEFYNYNNKSAKGKLGVAILKYSTADDRVSSSPKSCFAQQPCIMLNCPSRPNGTILINAAFYNCTTVDQLKGSSKMADDLARQNYSGISFVEYFFNFHFAGPGLDTPYRSSVNANNFKLPKAPLAYFTDTTAVTIPCDQKCKSNFFCTCTYKEQIQLGQVVQFIFSNLGNNIDGTAHPIHLHGHHFYVVKVGFPTYDSNGTFSKENSDISCSKICDDGVWASENWRNGNVPNLNLDNPALKDTVIVPVGGYVVVRFKADNPGYWFLHCHIEVHQAEGMSMIIEEGAHDDIAGQTKGSNEQLRCGDNGNYKCSWVNAGSRLENLLGCNIFVVFFALCYLLEHALMA